MTTQDRWIFFDVDDVLVDTSKQIEQAMHKMTGLHLPCEQWPHHMFTELYKIGAERRDEMRALWVQEKILENAAVFPGVTSAMQQLAGDGYRLGLITARAWHPDARRITETFVNEHRLPVDEIRLLGFFDSKADVLRDSGLTIQGFVDDTTRHAQSCAEAGIPSVLLSRAWNQDAPASLPRIESLDHFPHWVRNEAQRQALEEALAELFQQRAVNAPRR